MDISRATGLGDMAKTSQLVPGIGGIIGVSEKVTVVGHIGREAPAADMGIRQEALPCSEC